MSRSSLVQELKKAWQAQKAFATQMMLLWFLSVYIGKIRGHIAQKELETHIAQMVASAKKTYIESDNATKTLNVYQSDIYTDTEFFFIGRDVFYPLALEGALSSKRLAIFTLKANPKRRNEAGNYCIARFLSFYPCSYAYTLLF